MADRLLVVLATSGRPELLARTLSSLAHGTRPGAYAGTIVVDTGHTSGVREIVARFADALSTRYLVHPSGHKGLALNHALEHCDDALVVFTDDDVRFAPGTLEAYAGAARGIGAGTFFGGPVLPDYEEPPAAWLVPYLPASAKGFAMSRTESEGSDFMDRVPPVTELSLEGEVDPWSVPATHHRRFLGLNWAAFPADLRSAGLFDARFGPGAATRATGQETTLQDRMVEAGLDRRYVPAALVHHHVPRARRTESWALERAYRDGVQRGLTGRRAPRRAFWALVRAHLELLRHGRSADPERRFRPRFERRFLLGVHRGRWLRAAKRARRLLTDSDPIG